MSTPKPKGPAVAVPKQTGTAFSRTARVHPTVTEDDPYADRRGTINTRKTRGQFRTIEFIRAIQQHGYFLLWRKAVICPCLNPVTKQVEMNCDHCDGSGFFYFDPIETRGIMSRFERNAKTYEKFGSWVEGSAQLTVEPQYRMHYRDQIEMLDSVMTHSEVITKGDRHGLRSKLPENRDSARYRIHRMVQAVILDTDTQEITKLEEGYHYKVDVNGWVEWLAAGQTLVADETVISLLYDYHPIFMVMSHLHAFREAVLESKSPVAEVFSLPVQTTIKLDYLSDVSIPLPSMQPGPLPKYKNPETC
jgi:hypothetical protein